MNRLLYRLLSRHISYLQVLAFALASFVGMTLTIAAVQFYGDISPVLKGSNGVFGGNYVVVTKNVHTSVNDLTKGRSDRDSHAFSASDLSELNEQDFVKRVEGFMAADFTVRLKMSYQGGGLVTDAFFEAVSDSVIDVQTDEWEWEEGSKEIPIILPRNYLNVYNFGYAAASGMPKISEAVIRMVSAEAIIGSGMIHDTYRIHVVGFSNRLNTVLVPKSFLRWANQQYGSGEERKPSRIIVEMSNPADKNIVPFFEKHDYVMEQDNMESSRLSWFLQVIIGAVFVIGGIVCALAFYLLMLSVLLLLEKNQEQIRNLRCIGFSVGAISRPYISLICALTIVVLMLSVGVVYWARGLWLTELSAIYSQISGAEVLWTLAYIAALILFTNIAFTLIIRQKVKGM